MAEWSPDEARACYNLERWAEGCFDIDRGELVIRPDPDGPALPFFRLRQTLRRRGLRPPLLLRFPGILHHRLERLRRAFEAAGADGYTPLYPIKVNQQRRVVQTLAGEQGVGLEAGSKPELLAAMGLLADGGTLVCNGYKDRSYLRAALIAIRMGLRVFIVIDKPAELPLLIATAGEMGVEPLIGLRVRLASVAPGRWQNTGGPTSKFGLLADQVTRALGELEAAGMLGRLRLLHFHAGSQVASLSALRQALEEGTRYYVELRRAGAPLEVLDVGGGLAVDYQGTGDESEFSMNYSLEEYAATVVETVRRGCRDCGIPLPELMTEAGRAMTAHHALLIADVTDVERVPAAGFPERLPEATPEPLRELWRLGRTLDRESAARGREQAGALLQQARRRFAQGELDLGQRALLDDLQHALWRRLLELLDEEDEGQREAVDELRWRLADKYFCNFSLFQSLPDVWGLGQIFPVMPLQRLDQIPERYAVIEDLTCDSDGHIDRFPCHGRVGRTLPLHEPHEGEEYLLGFFLVGAYQEILGDMHNLFGDPPSVNVEVEKDGSCRLIEPHPGDRVRDLLAYVHIDDGRLLATWRRRLGEGPWLEELEGMLGDGTYLK